MKPCKPGLSDKRATVVSKIIALLLGLLSILLVVLIKFAGKGIVSVSGHSIISSLINFLSKITASFEAGYRQDRVVSMTLHLWNSMHYDLVAIETPRKF